MKYQTIHFSSIDSTNKYLKENFENLDDFTFVSTDYQTQGKGRNDRQWMANEKENLLFSLLIKNQSIINGGPFLSLIAAVSVSKVLEKYHLKNPQIKWPNDIYANNKKIVGILLEGRIPDYLIIGIGINVNQKLFEGEYRKEPTSMFLETGEIIDINELKKNVYEELFKNLNNYSSKKDKFFKYFKKHDYLINKKVNYALNNNVLSGTVVGIDQDFNIVIKNEDGECHIYSGEIDLLQE